MNEKWISWIANWVRRGELPVEFYDEVVGLAQNCLRETESNMQEPLELADELLAMLRQQRGKAIETKTLFYLEMKRLAIRWNKSRDEVDLRDVLRRTLQVLKNEGRVRRVDALEGSHSENHALWSSAGPEFDSALFDPITFERNITGLRKQYRKPWKSEAGTRREKILSLTGAKDLLLDLLLIARGPIPFRDLFDAASALVEVPKRVEVEKWEDVCKEGLLNPREDLIVAESVQAITESVWDKVNEANVKDTLCGYVLRKFLHGDSVLLRSLGTPQRAHESVNLVKAILGSELDPRQFASSSDLSRTIAAAVFQRLEEKCAENQSDRPSK